MKNDLARYLLLGLILAILMSCGLSGIVLIRNQRKIINVFSSAPVITKIPVMTFTPTHPVPTEYILDSGNLTENTIGIGAYVQISGTGGVGLRIRSAPGISSTPQFVAMENEVFSIIDGPIVMDDITWWLLEASYDKNRQGWAAGQYLAVINQP
jgi:hypothetical protein